MNPVIDAILTRRSVRAYLPDAVPADMVEQLLRCAMAAPSSKNRQPWEFVVVRERTVLDALAAGLPYAKMLADAPLAVVVCARACVDGAPNPCWQQDCAAATENLLLAAHSLGLGAVWTASYDAERAACVRRVLSVPEDILPFCVIPVGFPAGDGMPKDKWKPERIHKEKW
ncbi:MAG: nitroreductase family protein [Bacteroidales bacterium]|nr:nitroreductase family protein [Bacteroidales bacterium]